MEIKYEKIYIYKNGNLYSTTLVPENFGTGDLLNYMKKLKEIYGEGTEVRVTLKEENL